MNAFTWGSDYISTTITSLRPYPHTANAMGLHCVSDTSCWIYLLIGVYIILTSQFGFNMAQKSMPMLHSFCRHICPNASQLLKHMVLNCTLHWPMELFMFFYHLCICLRRYSSAILEMLTLTIFRKNILAHCSLLSHDFLPESISI